MFPIHRFPPSPLRVAIPLGLSVLALFAPPSRASNEWRTLHDGEGSSVVIRFEGTRDGMFLMRRRDDGRLFEVAPGMLRADDRTVFGAEAERLAGEITRLSEAAGHDLFNGTPIEDRDAAELARSLGLRPESQTPHSASWRLYPNENYRLFGARPYSVALYAGGDRRATMLSAVYANKGDFGSRAGQGEDHFAGETSATVEALAKAMAADEKQLADAITRVLGEPATQRFGERATRRTVRRWDWNGHSLLLSNEDGEYVSLAIVPVDLASAGGRTARVSNTDIKERLRSGIVRAENGDVFLNQIPMVDQGPKGYCVPATFERAMRVMGLEADMYLLAMVGQTSIGGGTSVERLLENIRSQVRSKGRRTRDIQLRRLRIRDVKTFIDDGIPVMWTMRSLPEYNQIANQNTAARRQVQDWQQWAQTIAARAEAITATEAAEANHHICMIVGYNEATNELAVSDSWGARYELRWVPVPVAEWASTGRLFLILP